MSVNYFHTTSYLLATDKPLYLTINFGNDVVFLLFGINITLEPHATDPNLIYIGSIGTLLPLCLNWRLGTFPRAPALSPPQPTSRGEFVRYVANLIDTA